MKDIERLAGSMKYLTRGWTENVEWPPTRVHSVRHEPMLAQLGYAALIRGTGETQHGSNPNKSGSRPPGNSAPLNMLDRISEEARAHYRDVLRLKGDEPSVVPTLHVADVLHNLMAECIAVQHEHPRMVRAVANTADAWVRSCRLLLGYEVRSVVLVEVVCDSCGGALSAPVDGSGDVVCIGSPYDDPQLAEPPCGRTYPRWSWPDLLAAKG